MVKRICANNIFYIYSNVFKKKKISIKFDLNFVCFGLSFFRETTHNCEFLYEFVNICSS